MSDGFGVSLLYGLTLLGLCGLIAWIGKLSDHSKMLRAVYDYSGVIIVGVPMVLALWLFTSAEEINGQSNTNVPVVQRDVSLERELPESECVRVLSTKRDRPAKAPVIKAGGVPPVTTGSD